MKQIQFLLALLTLIPAPGATLVADESGKQQQRTIATDSDRTDTQNFNDRLPPVVPGGEIFLNGKRIRVISTSGPVPVSPAPAAPSAACVPSSTTDCKEKIDTNGISVIVDGRGDLHRPRPGRTLGDMRLDEKGSSAGSSR